MPQLPGVDSLGGIPSANSGRAVATYDDTAIGQGIAGLGSDIFAAGARLKASIDKQQKADAYSSYLLFKAGEDESYQKARDGLQLGQIGTFAETYTKGFDGRSKAFLDSIPEQFRQEYGDRVFIDRDGYGKDALTFAQAEQTRQASVRLDQGIEQGIMPRARRAALLPENDPNKVTQLDALIAEGNALIDSQTLTPIQKEAAKAKLREKIQTGFAQSLSPAERIAVDPAFRVPPPVDDNGKPIANAGPQPTAWNSYLDAIPYDAKIAIAKDGSAAYVAAQNKAKDAAEAEYQAWFNSARNAVLDGKFGLADVDAAYRSGRLTKATDRATLQNMIVERDKEQLNLAGAAADFANESYKYNPFDNEGDVKKANLLYEKGGAQGGKGLLDPPSDKPDAIDQPSLLTGFVQRTGIIPDAAKEKIQAGIYSADPKEQSRAFTLMDALSRSDPAAYARAFTEDDRKRLGIYQALAPMVPPDVLAKALDVTNPQEAKIRADMEAKGREEAKKNFTDPGGIIAQAFGSWGQGLAGLLPGQPGTPTDPQTVASFMHDFENAYAEAYGFVRNSDAAKKLAFDWIKNRWRPTDIGSGDNTLMAYPPERYYPALNGNHHWMDEQLEASVKTEHKGAQTWGVVEAPQTETEATTGQTPGYYVWYTDENGGFRTAVDDKGTPLVVRFDYDKARQTALDNFNEKNAASHPPPQTDYIYGPGGAPPSLQEEPPADLDARAHAMENVLREDGKSEAEIKDRIRSYYKAYGKEPPDDASSGIAAPDATERMVQTRETAAGVRQNYPQSINVPVSRKTGPIGEQKVASALGATTRIFAALGADGEPLPAIREALRKQDVTWDKYARKFRGFFNVGPETPLTSEMVQEAAQRQQDKGLGMKGLGLFLDLILAIDSAMGKPKP